MATPESIKMIDKPVTAQISIMCEDMSKAPLGQKLLALNPSGVLVFAVLNQANIKYFTQWAPLPKKCSPTTLGEKDA